MNETPQIAALKIVNVVVHGPKGKAETWGVIRGAHLPRKIRRAMRIK